MIIINLYNFYERFLSPAFGALPKSEIELIFLEALEELGVVDTEPQVYELITKLKVTRAKAHNLIYERELRRSTPDELVTAKETLRKAGTPDTSLQGIVKLLSKFLKNEKTDLNE